MHIHGSTGYGLDKTFIIVICYSKATHGSYTKGCVILQTESYKFILKIQRIFVLNYNLNYILIYFLMISKRCF